MIKTGLIGTGFGLDIYAPSLKYHGPLELESVFSRNPRQSKDARKSFGFRKQYDNWKELIDSGVDLVIIATPPYTHYDIAKYALEQNKHVICAPPFASSNEEAEELVKMARDKGVIAVVDHHMNYLPARKYLYKLISDGKIGRLKHIDRIYRDKTFFHNKADVLWRFQKKSGGGVFPVHASHDLDLMLRVAGGVHEVQAAMHTIVDRRIMPDEDVIVVDAEDAYTLEVHFHNGATCSMHVNYAHVGRTQDEFIFYGTDGTLVLTNNSDLVFYPLEGGNRERLPIPPGFQSTSIPGKLQSSAFFVLTELVISAIYNNSPVSPTFDEAIHVQRILDAAEQSNKAGTWIEIGSDKVTQTRQEPGNKSVQKIYEQD